MPRVVRDLGTKDHKAASDFARAAASSDRGKTIVALHLRRGARIACRHTFRVRRRGSVRADLPELQEPGQRFAARSRASSSCMCLRK